MVVFSQNHDQVGNRMFGERLSTLVSYEALKLVAGTVLLSPYIPLLFMGEEYGDDSPFLYFVSHCDTALVAAVRQGRKKEFSGFLWKADPPDPQSIQTFLSSKIQWEKRGEGNNRVLLNFYKHLIRLRRTIPALSYPDKKSLHADCFEGEKIMLVQRWKDSSHILLLLNFNTNDVTFTPVLPEGIFTRILDSSEKTWNGPGTFPENDLHSGNEISVKGHSLVLYEKKKS